MLCPGSRSTEGEAVPSWASRPIPKSFPGVSSGATALYSVIHEHILTKHSNSGNIREQNCPSLPVYISLNPALPILVSNWGRVLPDLLKRIYIQVVYRSADLPVAPAARMVFPNQSSVGAGPLLKLSLGFFLPSNETRTQPGL